MSDFQTAEDLLLIQIPFTGQPKPRPRVVAGGHAYMPTHYTEWKEAIAANLQTQGLVGGSGYIYQGEQITQPVKLYARFSSDTIGLQLVAVPIVRPKYVRGDLDNLVGGLMDALQDAGILSNDSLVVSIDAEVGPDTEVITVRR